MNLKEAIAIYHAGQQSVTGTLLAMDTEINNLKKIIESQKIKIAKLSKNSSNSSKRPSSDDITKPKKKNNEDQKRQIGGQLGHPKHQRPAFAEDEIDQFHHYWLHHCPICNGDVTFINAQPRVTQQIEIQKLVTQKQEHRSYPFWCENCQQIHYHPFPPEIVKEGLFKARITAVVAYMSNVCHASFSTIRKFIRDILGENLSRGYLAKLIEKVSMSLEKPYQQLLDRLPLETVLNVDETGHKENGDRFWTWVFKAELYVLFKIDKSRGSKVLIEVLGKEFDGVIGSDYYSSYRKFMKDFNVSIQFCIAHLIRDIKFLTTLPDAQTKAYGVRLLDAVKNMFKIIHQHGQFNPHDFVTALEQAKSQILTLALQDVPSYVNAEGKEEKKEAYNMAKRFRDHGEAYFTFITTPGMDPTNNVAEQAIRFVVIDRHIKQGTRSIKGRKANERLWTVIATCALQGRSAYNFILKAVEAYFHDKPSPSLLNDTS